MNVSRLRGLVAAVSILAGTVAHAAPPTAVPKGHPRVYLRAADLPAIKAKLALAEFASSWNAVKGSTDPVCRAFVYLTQGDATAGQQAVTAALSELKACTDARQFGTCMLRTAMVYDWCYPLLSAAQRSAFIAELERVAGLDPPGFPANPGTGAVVGHASEGWLLTGQLPAGVAIYDEKPAMYDAAAKLFFDRFVPVRNYSYPAHMHHQGDSYGAGRFEHDLGASWLFKRMGGGDVVSTEQRHVPYQFIYSLRPDGQQLRSGDTFDDPGKSANKRGVMALAGAYYQDPYLLSMADWTGYWQGVGIDHVLRLLLRPAGVTAKPISGLPLTKYFPPPMGEMVARTGWQLGVDSPDAVVQMRIGGTFFGNHQHKDFGTFQIYHRGALAIDSGAYGGEGTCEYGTAHWASYHHQTIAHNGLLILDPSEQMILGGEVRANDGGQLWPNKGSDHPGDLDTLTQKGYELAAVKAHQLGPSAQTPEYSYLAGDITKAYAASKASLVTRSMATLRTGDAAYPALLVVFDRVTATKAAFKKTWLLHTIEQPTIKGSTITVTRTAPTYDKSGTYGGKLVVESLLPLQASRTAVGGAGKAFWVESTATNYSCAKPAPAEPGEWRVEVSPTAAATADTFLHVLTVMKSSTASGPAVALVEGTSHVGAVALDRAVLFGRTVGPHGQADFKLSAPAGGPASFKILVCDLEPGSYLVTRDGAAAGQAAATAEGGCVYVNGGTGSYTVKPGGTAVADAGAGEGPGGGSGDGSTGDRGSANRDGELPAGEGRQRDDGDSPRPSDGCACSAAGEPGRSAGAALPSLGLALLLLVWRRRREVAAGQLRMRHERRSRMTSRATIALTPLLILLSGASAATTFHVAAGGNDAAPGTSPSVAWASLAKVNAAALVVGDQVLFNRGDSWSGTVKARAGVTYGAYGTGARPVIDGSQALTGWTKSGTIWTTSVGNEIKQVFVDGKFMPVARHPNQGAPPT